MESSIPLQTAWEYGATLIAQRQVDAGLGILQSVVTHEPNDLDARRSLREIERELVQRQSTVEESASMVLNDVWVEIRQAKRKRTAQFIDWDGIDSAAERGLAVDPWNVDLHVELGQACQARGHHDTARFAYECALEIKPDRTDVQLAIDALAKLS